MKKLFAVSLAALALAVPAHAQETIFTTEDADLMTGCVEPVLERMRDTFDPDQSTATTTALADCIGIASGACMEEPGGSSNAGMDECLMREIDWWDSQLNVNYTSLIDQIDEQSATALQEAQRSWIAWRDDSCEFEYTYWREGTIRSIYYQSCMLNETAKRAIKMQDYVGWLDL